MLLSDYADYDVAMFMEMCEKGVLRLSQRQITSEDVLPSNMPSPRRTRQAQARSYPFPNDGVKWPAKATLEKIGSLCDCRVGTLRLVETNDLPRITVTSCFLYCLKRS